MCTLWVGVLACSELCTNIQTTRGVVKSTCSLPNTNKVRPVMSLFRKHSCCGGVWMTMSSHSSTWSLSQECSWASQYSPYPNPDPSPYPNKTEYCH